MQAQWVCSRERRIALYKRSSINHIIANKQKPQQLEECPGKILQKLYQSYISIWLDSATLAFARKRDLNLKPAHTDMYIHTKHAVYTQNTYMLYTHKCMRTHTHPHTHSVTLTSYRSIGSSCCSSCSFIKRYSFWYFFIFLAVTCHGTANTNFNSWATQTVKTVKLNNILMNRSKITLKLHTIKTINKQFTSSSFSQWWEWDFSHISPAHTTFSPKTGWTAGFYLRHTHIAFSPNTGWTAGFYLRHTNKHTLPYHPL